MVREDLPGVYLNRARHHNMMRSKYVVVSLVSGCVSDQIRSQTIITVETEK